MKRIYKFINNKYAGWLLLSFIIIFTPVFIIGSGCDIQDMLVNEDWPMFKYNIERTGSSSDFDFDNIELQWQYSYEIFEEGGGSRVSPAIAENKVVIPTRYYTSCIDTDTGELIWRKYIGDNNSSPIIYRNNVIISATNNIYSFGLKDGYYNWGIDLKKEGYITAGISVPIADDGKIYYGLRGKDDNEGYLYCLDEKDGSTIWRFQTSGPVRTSPVIAVDKILFGADNGTLYCLDKNTGEKLWTFRTLDKIRSSPAIYNDHIFFGSNDTYMYCVDIDSGKQLWKFKSGDIINTTPGAAENRLFFSSNDGNVYCLDVENGDLIWKYSNDDLIFTSPVICGKKLLIGLDNRIYCLDSEKGYLIREYKLDDFGISTPMSVRNNKLYLRTISYVYCFQMN
jgi:outer membrane protein assembly factor BamB